MTYTITDTRQEGEILLTNLNMILDDGTELQLEVAHFMPKSFDEIHQNIINRSISEQSKLETIRNMPDLINQIPINQPITE